MLKALLKFGQALTLMVLVFASIPLCVIAGTWVAGEDAITPSFIVGIIIAMGFLTLYGRRD